MYCRIYWKPLKVLLNFCRCKFFSKVPTDQYRMARFGKVPKYWNRMTRFQAPNADTAGTKDVLNSSSGWNISNGYLLGLCVCACVFGGGSWTFFIPNTRFFGIFREVKRHLIWALEISRDIFVCKTMMTPAVMTDGVLVARLGVVDIVVSSGSE